MSDPVTVRHQIDWGIGDAATPFGKYLVACAAWSVFDTVASVAVPKLFPDLHSVDQDIIRRGFSTVCLIGMSVMPQIENGTVIKAIAVSYAIFFTLYRMSKLWDQEKVIHLPSYLEDLNKEAKNDSSVYKLDPEIVEEMEDALSRLEYSNCTLIGSTGCGKTSTINAIAKKIVNNEFPVDSPFYGKRILSLNKEAIMADCHLIGKLSTKIDNLVKYLKKHPDVILFIDEVHAIFDLGNHRESHADNVAELLKPHIARGVKIIGATTPHDLANITTKNPAFSRRFKPIYIKPPSASQCIQMLKDTMQSTSYQNTYPGFQLDDRLLAKVYDLSNRLAQPSDPNAEVQPSLMSRVLESLAQKFKRQKPATIDSEWIGKIFFQVFRGELRDNERRQQENAFVHFFNPNPNQ